VKSVAKVYSHLSYHVYNVSMMRLRFNLLVQQHLGVKLLIAVLIIAVLKI